MQQYLLYIYIDLISIIMFLWHLVVGFPLFLILPSGSANIYIYIHIYVCVYIYIYIYKYITY